MHCTSIQIILGKGRGLVADRKIDAGESIFDDVPIVSSSFSGIDAPSSCLQEIASELKGKTH